MNRFRFDFDDGRRVENHNQVTMLSYLCIMQRSGFIFLILILFQQFVSAQLTCTKISNLPEKMYETSGLVLIDDKYLVTHNDGGNESELFIINLKDGSFSTVEIEDAKNNDWEDITQDTEGNLFIGDFGNNLNKREHCTIYKINAGYHDKKRVESKKITFTYADQEKYPPEPGQLNFDCEAMIWKDDSLYLFSKCRTEPFTGLTNIYVLPDAPGKYTARKIGSIQLCSSDWRFCSVTAADYSVKQNTLILLTYSRIYIVSDFEANKFWEGKVKSYQLSFIKQREAICFKDKNTWYMTDEYRKGLGGGNLYEVKLKKE